MGSSFLLFSCTSLLSCFCRLLYCIVVAVAFHIGVAGYVSLVGSRCHKRNLAKHDYLCFAEIEHSDWMLKVKGTPSFNQSKGSISA